MSISARTLVLNSDYTPLAIINWKRALILLGDKKVYEVDFYTDIKALDSAGRYHPVPAVVCSYKYKKRKAKSVPFTRKNVYIRDALTCQYCGYQGEPEEMTYDHVIPRSLWNKKRMPGTPTCWINIVTCCRSCNEKKADMTLEQAKMVLKKKPREPKDIELVLGIAPWKNKTPKEWLPYLKDIYDFLRDKDARKT